MGKYFWVERLNKIWGTRLAEWVWCQGRFSEFARPWRSLIIDYVDARDMKWSDSDPIKIEFTRCWQCGLSPKSQRVLIRWGPSVNEDKRDFRTRDCSGTYCAQFQQCRSTWRPDAHLTWLRRGPNTIFWVSQVQLADFPMMHNANIITMYVWSIIERQCWLPCRITSIIQKGINAG